jgi:pyruvate dehydrogenase E1 component alpha subunit
LEAQTYRFRGHSISDPANYRPEIEVSYWMSRDPIEMLKTRLIKEDMVSQEDLDAIHKLVESEIVEAVNFAEKSPFPSADELYQNVVSGSGE